MRTAPVYKIKDYDREFIDGIFYDSELQKVTLSKDKPYQVEEILDKHIKHGKKYIVVR